MHQRLVAVTTAAVLAVLAASFFIWPDSVGREPWILGLPLGLGILHGLAVVRLASQLGPDARPDLIRWVALSYGTAIGAGVIGLVVPFFQTILVLGLAFLAGGAAPLVLPDLVSRSRAARPRAD